MPVTIIGGKLKGRKLSPVGSGKDTITRPILARVKKSLFDIIRQKIPGACFLDLYAGTGSVGIEALSRGAAYYVFIDSDRGVIDLLNKNLTLLGLQIDAVAYQRDLSAGLGWLKNLRADVFFDIIFIGAPYRNFVTNKMLGNVTAAGITKETTLIIAQHHKNEKIDAGQGYGVFREERYGDTVLSFIRKACSGAGNGDEI